MKNDGIVCSGPNYKGNGSAREMLFSILKFNNLLLNIIDEL